MITRRLTKWERRLIFICVLAIFVYAARNFAYIPLRDKLTLNNARIAKKERELKENLKIVRKAKTVEDNYAKHAELLKQVTSDEQAMTSILAEIQAAAGLMTIRIVDMKPDKVKRVDFYNNFSVNIVLEGELNVVTQFLYTLANDPHKFHIDEVRFEKKSLRTAEIRCSLVLSRALILP